MYVGCPICRGWMVGDGIPVGAAVLCPHCQRQFVMTQAILAAAMQSESPPAGPSVSAGPPGEAVSPGLAGAPMGGMPQATSPGLGPTLPPSGGLAGPAGPTGPVGTMPSGGWGMPPGGGMAQTPAMGQMGIPCAGMPPAAIPGGRPPGDVGSAMPGSFPGPPTQAMGYPPSAAPADRAPTRPRARRPLLGREALGIMGFSLMVVAIIVVVIGHGDRPAFRHLGPQEKQGAPGDSSGPQMIVSYEPRKGILYIENADRDWKEAELRINADPADDEGGYRCQLGPVPRGRKKPILLNQCLSPSGARFEGELERIVVIAQTVDGELRYVSQAASSK